MGKRDGEGREWGKVKDAIEAHQSALIRYASSIVGDRDRAKDVVQDVFLKLCKQPWENVEGHLANWLFRVTRNQALDLLRKEKRMSLFEDSETMERLAGVGDNVEQRARSEERAGSLLELVNQLPAREREVVTLKFEQGMSYKEIGAVTGLSASNVGYMLHHALNDLRCRWKTVESV